MGGLIRPPPDERIPGAAYWRLDAHLGDTYAAGARTFFHKNR